LRLNLLENLQVVFAPPVYHVPKLVFLELRRIRFLFKLINALKVVREFHLRPAPLVVGNRQGPKVFVYLAVN